MLLCEYIEGVWWLKVYVGNVFIVEVVVVVVVLI